MIKSIVLIAALLHFSACAISQEDQNAFYAGIMGGYKSTVDLVGLKVGYRVSNIFDISTSIGFGAYNGAILSPGIGYVLLRSAKVRPKINFNYGVTTGAFLNYENGNEKYVTKSMQYLFPSGGVIWHVNDRLSIDLSLGYRFHLINPKISINEFSNTKLSAIKSSFSDGMFISVGLMLEKW